MCCFQPSSAIFTLSIILLGVLIIISATLLRRGGDPYFSTFLSVSIFALIAFIFGAAASIASYRILRSPARIVTPVMGFLVLFITGIDLGLGPGGVERLVAYFELIPGIVIGSYLSGAQQGSSSVE